MPRINKNDLTRSHGEPRRKRAAELQRSERQRCDTAVLLLCASVALLRGPRWPSVFNALARLSGCLAFAASARAPLPYGRGSLCPVLWPRRPLASAVLVLQRHLLHHFVGDVQLLWIFH